MRLKLKSVRACQSGRDLATPAPTPRPEPRRHVFRYWRLECLSLAVCVGLFIAIVGILAKFDKKRMPEWPHTINLNSLIALLSTVLRAIMLVVLSEVISQLKWAWFYKEPRPLIDIQSFDDASRGVLGSIGLVGVLGLGSMESILGLMAAMATILSLAIGPLLQQAIRSVPCPQIKADLVASIPVAHAVPGPGGLYHNAQAELEVDVALKGTILNALTSPGEVQNSLRFVCPTGNCTFAEFRGVTHSTIGVCSKCVDTTEFASVKYGDREEGYTDLLQLNGNTIGGYRSHLDFMAAGLGALNMSESFVTREFDGLALWGILNITVLTLTNATCAPGAGCLYSVPAGDDQVGYLGVSCVLYPCLKEFSGRIHQGQLEERLVSTVSAVPAAGTRFKAPDPADDGDFVAVKSPCLIGDAVYGWDNFSLVQDLPGMRMFAEVARDGKVANVPSECLYRMHYPYSSAIHTYIRGLFRPGAGCLWYDFANEIPWCRTAWWLGNLIHEGMATLSSVESAMDSLATAITNHFRITGYGPLNDTLDYPPRSFSPSAYEGASGVHGAVHETTICIELEWPWIILPATLCFATVVALIIVVTWNYLDDRLPVWKSSALPLLFYGFVPRESRSRILAMSDAATIRELEVEAENITVHLQGGSTYPDEDIYPLADTLPTDVRSNTSAEHQPYTPIGAVDLEGGQGNRGLDSTMKRPSWN